jgi:uncharacterized Ntn-hydrolase superfamily protein
MRKILFLSFLFPIVFSQFLSAQVISFNKLAHTFSIVARDSVTGEMGVAVQSHWFAVGKDVSWAEAGVGAIATQSFINPDFGPEGLALLRSGKTAGETLEKLLSHDEGRDFRQVAVVDAKGNVAVHTGRKCIAFASDIKGGQFSVQANMMLNDRVIPAMYRAYSKAEGSLAERLYAALMAAQVAGGDIRGQQAAAIKVVSGKKTGHVAEDVLVDIRVDDASNAVVEIGRVLEVQQAYQHMNNGDLAIEKGNEEAALREYGEAMKMFPNNLEMKYWYAVSLVNMGKLEKALPIFKEIFARNINWKILTPRLIANGLLKVDSEGLKKISSQ